MSVNKLKRQERRKSRVRYKLKEINFANASKMNTPAKPRLSVFRSNKHVYVQIIDDIQGVTLASASSLEKELRDSSVKLSAKAIEIGRLIGQRARAQGIKEVIYDRGGYKFHGIVLNVIEAARESFANNKSNI